MRNRAQLPEMLAALRQSLAKLEDTHRVDADGPAFQVINERLKDCRLGEQRQPTLRAVLISR